jgi:hypothetical protein
VDSSLVGYDGARNVRDEERSVGRKALVRKAEPPSEGRIAWPRWTGFRGMTLRDWLPIVGTLLIPVMIAFGTWGAMARTVSHPHGGGSCLGNLARVPS